MSVSPGRMARVLRFNTALFDVSKERPNHINLIPGESLLLWLIEQSGSELEISRPAPEDWGWYSYAVWNGRKYLLGACACGEAEDGQREWVLQIEKQRSLKEKLQGREKMANDDDCADYFQSLLAREFPNVSVDPDP